MCANLLSRHFLLIKCYNSDVDLRAVTVFIIYHTAANNLPNVRLFTHTDFHHFDMVLKIIFQECFSPLNNNVVFSYRLSIYLFSFIHTLLMEKLCDIHSFPIQSFVLTFQNRFPLTLP